MASVDVHKWADFASILAFLVTGVAAVVGIFGYIRYQCDLRKKSKRLEDFLRAEKMKGEDRGQRSIIQIIKDVGLTKDEIIQVSFRNRKVVRRAVIDEKTGLAKELLFEYEDGKGGSK
jgi:hypothetical protein